MATVYTLLSWLLFFVYWLVIAAITVRILVKRRPVTSAMTWLLIIYILPLVGIIAYIAFGELHLGKRRVDKAQQMWPSVATWLENLRHSKHILPLKIVLLPSHCFNCVRNGKVLLALKAIEFN